MPNPLVHLELWTKSPKAIADFYARAFDWKVREFGNAAYWMVESGDGGATLGVFTPEKGTWPGNMAGYIRVPDLARALEGIRAAGGTVLVERQDVPNVGAFALFRDPDGRVMGLWQ